MRFASNFGLKVGVVAVGKFDERMRELVAATPELFDIMETSLTVRQALRESFTTPHRKLLAIVRDDYVCRQLMTIPGNAPVVSLAFTAMIDIPASFKTSKAAGPSLD